MYLKNWTFRETPILYSADDHRAEYQNYLIISPLPVDEEEVVIPCSRRPRLLWFCAAAAHSYLSLCVMSISGFRGKRERNSVCLAACARSVRPSTGRGRTSGTLHQKGTQVRFLFPARIPAPHDLPWNGLSENVKIKKIYRGVLSRKFWKTTCLQIFS